MNCGWLKQEVDGECCWHWPTVLILWTVLNCSPMWFTIWQHKRTIVPQDSKYAAFRRPDLDQWSYTATLFTHFFFIPRSVLAWFLIMLGMICCGIASIGHQRGTKPAPWRVQAYRRIFSYLSRGIVGCYGIWIRKKYVVCDYSHWLGPEWQFDERTSYSGAGTLVSNQQSFADIFSHLILQDPVPAYVSDDSVRYVPFIGFLADTILNSLFFTRTEKKSKALMFAKLQERQKLAAAG